MPFVSGLTLGERPDHEQARPQKLVPAGTLVGTGQNLAVLSDGASEFYLKAPLQGLLVEWLAQSDEALDPDAPVARIVAEGAERPVDDATPVRFTQPC